MSYFRYKTSKDQHLSKIRSDTFHGEQRLRVRTRLITRMVYQPTRSALLNSPYRTKVLTHALSRLYVASIAALSRLGTLAVIQVARLQCAHYNNCVLPKPLSHLHRNQASLRQLGENIFQMWRVDSLRLALSLNRFRYLINVFQRSTSFGMHLRLHSDRIHSSLMISTDADCTRILCLSRSRCLSSFLSITLLHSV